MITPTSAHFRAGALGFSGGMRTFTPLAVLHLSGGAFAGRLGRVLLVAAAGELVLDKLPQTPSRLEPAALGARLASGAVAGRAVAGLHGIPIGAAAALAGALAGYAARQALAKAKGWPDYRCALIEDAFAVALAGIGAA